MIVTVSADIVASSSITFTDDEITSLTAVEETLTAAVGWSLMHSRRPRPLWRTPPDPRSPLPVSPLLPPLSPPPVPGRGSEDSSPRGTCSSNSTATTIFLTTRLMNPVMGSIRHKNRKHKTYVEHSLA